MSQMPLLPYLYPFECIFSLMELLSLALEPVNVGQIFHPTLNSRTERGN